MTFNSPFLNLKGPKTFKLLKVFKLLNATVYWKEQRNWSADQLVCSRCPITVNVEIFAQYIFSCISRRPLDARKFDMSENYCHNR